MHAGTSDEGCSARVEQAVRDIAAGKMVILVDDEDRENEGDLVMAADTVTPEAINFMARFGRGLICLTLTEEWADHLQLPLQNARAGGPPLGTAFTVSIEARHGVTSGISAADRAHTILTAVAKQARPDDLVTPGHIFPLRAKRGGTLVRTGHTEGSVDLVRLAGHAPAAVICEIMNDDGTMARLPDLIAFAQHHNLRIGTIADLIAYRRRYDHPIKRQHENEIDSDYGGKFRLYVYVNELDGAEHIALVKGDLTSPEPVLVRMHAVNLFDDLLGASLGRQDLLRQAMREISDEGRGVLVLIRDTKDTTVAEMGRRQQDKSIKDSAMLKEYGVGAQILVDLGVHNMTLLSRSEAQKPVGLEGYGLEIIGRRDIPRERK